MDPGSGGDGDPDLATLRGAAGLAAAGRRRLEGGGPTGDRPLAAEQNHHQQQQQQQQLPKQLIRWERFLPRRSLRVLLVEHDDSTRHIVAALLRKCSYQVTAVADGLKAWEVLKEKEYKIDLVLTEVEMPSLSGIDLLSQITGCDLSRNIPVIMMSSQDSVSIVFDCMRKGAVDFLVKPVRRNELRNLWQHVWRKHCSSNNYGLESTNNQTKSEDISRNDAAINRMNANVNGIKNREVCDEGSDTQSSGSKPETCGQHVKNVEPTASECRSSIPMEKSIKKQYDEKEIVKNKRHDGHRENKQLTVGRNADSVQDDACSEKRQRKHEILNAKSSIQIQGRFLNGNENVDQRSAVPASFDLESARSKPSKEIIDFIGAAANGECSSAQEKDDHRERFQHETVESNRDTNPATTSGMLSWELSLRGPDMDNCSKQAFQERHILKHSSASAFSRYGKGIQVCQKSGTAQVTLSMTTGQPHEKLQKFSTTNNKDEAASYPLWRSSSAPGNDSEVLACHQVSSSDNKDVGPPDDLVQGSSREDPAVSNASLDKNNCPVVYHPGQIGLMTLPFPVGGIPLQSLCPGYGAILPPVFYSKPSQHGSITCENSKDLISPNQMNECNKHLAYDHPSTQDHHPFHSEEVKNGEEPRDPRVLVCSSKDPTEQGDLHSKNVHGVIWSSGSGEMTDAVGNSGMVTDNGNDNGFQNGKALDWDRSRREAALLKFRMKRKDRCFEKKVRYHSRKKLAEQRPRIKGQFVRRSAVDTTAVTTEEDD